MSDSSDCEWEDFSDQLTAKQIRKYDQILTLRPPEEVFERWIRVPPETRREAGRRMRICVFWLPIVLQPEEYCATFCWALELGLIPPGNELGLNNLQMISTVETILRALERGTLEKDQTKQVVLISNLLNLRCDNGLIDASQWLDRTGEPYISQSIRVMGNDQVRHSSLHLIFTEFAKYIHEMGTDLEKTLRSLMARPSTHLIKQSEEMKRKGNENFEKKQYEDAVLFYSKAIQFYPDNHIAYGNRALCYIRCDKFLKAACDGKCATLIDPFWAKGHYRYCEALCSMGALTMAIEANSTAQSLCKDDHKGMRDLEQQQQKLRDALNARVSQSMKKKPSKRTQSPNKAPWPPLVKADKKNDPPSQTKGPEVKPEEKPVKNEKTAQSESVAKNSKPAKSELSSKNGKLVASSPKKKPKMKKEPEEEKRAPLDRAAVCKELMSMVQDAHTALTDLRSRNAEEAFRKALVLLETSPAKELGLSTLDVLLLLYGRVLALTEIGQLEELVEAQALLEKIKSFEERTFQCLVYYAVGKVYLRENRFSLALVQFSDSLQTVKNKITPGKLTWPLTKEIVKETQPEYFTDVLERAIELCKFPPIPDAICRLEKCLVPLKAEIYLTDPDFKGYIRICCCESCVLEYHTACWKSLKTSFFEKNEKDFLKELCFTPDCVGKICKIQLFRPTGLLKCEFVAPISKPLTPKKPKQNQKCSSLKKLKSKEEHKLTRKQHKLSFQEKQAINDEILQQIEAPATHNQQKAWRLYRDPVLLQTSQNAELLREEKCLSASDLAAALRPWLELDSSRGNQVAERMLNLKHHHHHQQEEEEAGSLRQALDLLLERKNRIWARVLVHLLCDCEDINPKLGSWAIQLNNAGLKAARSFIERHAEHLEQLDLSILLNFGPLQDAIIEKFGTRTELFSSSVTVTDHLKQAPPHDMRLFIWTLEEHRDKYLTCHQILDDYFDMDGHCSVLKKSDENENNSPMKSRGRKKKAREPRAYYVFPGTRASTPGDECEQDLFEEDSLSFLHPGDPFSVPSHLREEVADFEEHYNSTRHRGHYKMILDNNPDPTKESLYDYFAQILEEHGPLEAEDPLLSGELVNFPAVAQLKMQEAGGFEAFLLESLRFIKIGCRVGLIKHAVCLQQQAASLDDLDVITDPGPVSRTPYLNGGLESAFRSHLDSYFPAQTDVGPFVPNPYVISSQAPPRELHSPYVLATDYGGLDLDLDGGPSAMSSVTANGGLLKKHERVQTCQENMRSVAVNTEMYERFESSPGDVNMKQKSYRKLEKQIKKMVKGCDRFNQRHKEDIAVLEEEIQEIKANIQVTNRELALFQQKLEEEVKKDQKEKKSNQEGLRVLKMEIEELGEQHGRLSRGLQEKKASFDLKLSDFLESSNQSAAEKMSIEEEINRCKAAVTAATRRSRIAQVWMLESSRDQVVFPLYTELAVAKALLGKLDEAAQRYPNPEMEMARNIWRVNVQEVEKKISSAEALYQEQLDQANNGRRLTEWSPVNGLSDSPAAPSAAAITPSEAASAQAPPPLRPASRTLEPQHNTVFDQSVERLAAIFPAYTRSDFMRFVQEFRSSSGGNLSNMTIQEMVGGVTQLILDHQEKPKAAASSARTPCTAWSWVAPVWKAHGQKTTAERNESSSKYGAPPHAPPAWQPAEPKRDAPPNALNVEDPCIICHEDMNPIDICVLECRHSFHDACIRSWLKENRTCPTCRDPAILSDEFPALAARRRPAP
ncbi:E3 ubiquitin-protein ligase TTC3 [Pungitius pungitius]|uniref:E3 ubiquitin-protein ligase TTC3 n=1 Tax=Pungitius pungitius TaxID=134920 RepID=UPI002E10DEB7